MPSHRKSARLKSRVSVSTTGDRSPELKSHTGPVGLNSLHESRLITSLVDYYGWTLCADGNLYNPRPGSSPEERYAA